MNSQASKCELFKCIKDILDFWVLKIIDHFNEKIDEEIYKIIQTMQVFGIHSYGKKYFYLLFFIF